ncbi:7533_t:CDS:2 [Funneliformis caledonium]|uniref:7533_t:CDS:1 n=1 Tax=Funneliformis caledonium TaxID=1117310 RepID=A0A9N8WCE5_9GLOM|nr:7533_t:CDS:2 [Funneliformis caledonium]
MFTNPNNFYHREIHDGIEISAAEYDIYKAGSSLSRIDKGNLIESGVYMKKSSIILN